MKQVAIIGAGPAGLVAARYMQQHGLEPVALEQSGDLGGQWNTAAPHSGVWPAMRTNTNRLQTCFSDLPHANGVTVYPHNRDIHAYLHRYARHFGLSRHLRLNSRVVELDRSAEGGWRIDRLAADGTVSRETFAHVVVATGRYSKPKIPAIPGVETFTGSGGISHTFAYRQPERYRGMQVIVAGGNISALEIASELAHHAKAVISSQRRQRYVLNKLVGGIPVEMLAFTRFAALAGETFPPAANAQALKDFAVRMNGRLERLGALAPAEDIGEAGITLAQHFPLLVAEGRIVTKPWMTEIDGRRVHFSDGSWTDADGIIFGTGFEPHLPFLGERLRQVVHTSRSGLDLYANTLHPDLPDLAFLGHYDIVGPYFPVVELQARWLAYVWSGLRPSPARDELERGLAAQRTTVASGAGLPMHALALQFARLAGAEPELPEFPALTRALLFGPLTPVSFRLSGADRLPEAAQRLAAEAAAFGAVPTAELSIEQRGQLQALAGARADARLAALAAQPQGSASGRVRSETGSATVSPQRAAGERVGAGASTAHP